MTRVGANSGSFLCAAQSFQGWRIGRSVTRFDRLADGALSSETIPKLWDMPDEEAAARMRQWTRFEPGFSNVVMVRCEFVSQRAVNDRCHCLDDPRALKPGFPFGMRTRLMHSRTLLGLVTSSNPNLALLDILCMATLPRIQPAKRASSVMKAIPRPGLASRWWT